MKGNNEAPAKDIKQQLPEMAVEWFLRITLATAFLSAVADRLGLWGGPGTPNIAWGDWNHFLVYSTKLNAWLPDSTHLGVAVLATLMETVIGVGLLVPRGTRWIAAAAGLLLCTFALAMTFALGVKAPLNYSVWTASAAAFALARATGKHSQP